MELMKDISSKTVKIKMPSELELVRKAADGDQNAFRVIVENNKNVVASTVKGMLGDCLEAEDVGQEVFIRFHKSIENFRGDSKLSTYLVRIAINLSLNEIKRQKRKSIFSFGDSESNELKDLKMNSQDKEFEKKELISLALNKIEGKFRSVIVLRLINGYSTEETAKILNIPKGTVLSRLARANKKLKKLLTPYLEGLL